MEACSECQTMLESWEVTCHGCGHLVSAEAVPIVLNDEPPVEQIEEAFQQWLDKGKSDLEREKFEEAAADFHEALRRTHAIKDGEKRAVEVRNLLAEALEKAGKMAEAAQQISAVIEKTTSAKARAKLEKKTEELKKVAVDLSLITTAADTYRALEGAEGRYVPLYCSDCHRLLNEGEVFGFRRGRVTVVRCLCGFEGLPVAKLDAKHTRAVKDALQIQGRKAVLLAAASQKFPQGKKRAIAVVLALVFGNFGLNKLYLGERGACIVSIVFCWTFIPWIFALFDAIGYMSMSEMSWNLNFNIDHVLASIPAEALAGEAHEDVFSMEFTEDPEDFVDEFTSGEGAKAKKPV